MSAQHVFADAKQPRLGAVGVGHRVGDEVVARRLAGDQSVPKSPPVQDSATASRNPRERSARPTTSGNVSSPSP